MTRAALRSVGATLLLVLLGSPDLARAKPAPKPTSSEKAASESESRGAEQFTEGRRLYKEGTFAAALPLFEAALEASGSPNARLYVARTLRELGRLPEAHEQMSQALADARARAETEPRYVATRDAAAAELAMLESKVGRLVIALGPRAKDAKISLDGKPVAAERLGRVMVVDPGKRTIVAEAAGKGELVREVTIEPGATESVLLAFDPSAEAPKTAPAAPAEEDTAGSSFGPVRAAGVVVAVVGVAGLVVYAVSASEAKSSYDTLNEECGGVRCTDLSYGDEVDYGETMETLSHVTLAVGLAAVVAGGLMLVIGDGDAEPAQTATLGVRAGGPWIGYEARF